MLGFIKKMFAPAVDFKQLLADGALIVDVRTPAEYKSERASTLLLRDCSGDM